MTTIYCKTSEGQSEIETRARRLAPRLRSALILVDGKRTDKDLRKLLLQEPDQTLQALLDAGLIELVPMPPRTASAAAGADGRPAGEGFDTLRRESARALNQLLGPQSDALAIKLESAADPQQLRAALERAVEWIANARGAAAAAQFASRFIDPPGAS